MNRRVLADCYYARGQLACSPHEHSGSFEPSQTEDRRHRPAVLTNSVQCLGRYANFSIDDHPP